MAVAAHVGDPIGAGRACLAYLSVWLSNGALAHIHVNWLSPTKIRTTVFGGSRRTIVWDDTNPAGRLAVHDRASTRCEAADLPQDQRRQALISYRTGDTLIPALPEREPLHVRHGRVQRGDRPKRRPPLTDAPRRACGCSGCWRRRRGARRAVAARISLDGSMVNDQPQDGFLVTGGAGTIGSTIVDQLGGRGRRRDRRAGQLRPGQSRRTWPRPLRTGQVRVVDGDIRDRNLVRSLMPGIDVVFHQAAIRITQCADRAPARGRGARRRHL